MNRLLGRRPKANEASPSKGDDSDEATAQLTSQLGTLNLQAQAPPLPPKPSQQRTLNLPFPGGFHPTLAIGSNTPNRPANDNHNDSRPPAFPQADQYALPGPLPVPPAMPIPLYADTIEMSMTMRHALGLQNDVYHQAPTPPLRANHLQPLPPKLPPRPVSDPPPQTTSESISAGPRPTSKRRDGQLAVTTGPQAVASGAGGSKSRRRSSTASAPASPVSGRTSSSGVVQCHGAKANGDRCKREIKKKVALGVLQPEIDDELPVYCFQHSRQIQSNTHRILHGQPVAYDDYIPSLLQADTANALRTEMAKELSISDGPGYIYIFEIVDPTDTDKYRHFKVGRATELNKRQNEWRRQCVGQHQAVIGWWPGRPGGDGALHGTNKPGPKGPHVARLERLIHLELADWALNAPYLDEAERRERKALPPREECKHCGVRHQEIFTFRRANSGKYKDREFEEIVWKIVEKWGGFVSK